MVFACQNNSFLTEFSSKVVSCRAAKIPFTLNGKKEVIEGFEVILEDTILFPEGGGQPFDHGTINGEPVVQVTRKGGDAVHFIRSPVTVGTVVKEKLDWNRRLDHMQQHSGQHLITAVADSEYGFPTSSWWLGEEISYLELDTPTVSEEQVIHLEKLVNEYIREGRPVTVKVYQATDPELKNARTRGLPDDHVGFVRIVTIENLENNMCCGTHVSNLGQLQMIKLLGVEKGKKGKVKLNFIAGSRVLTKLGELLTREASLSNLLQNKGSTHVELVRKVQDSFKAVSKNLQSVLREVAIAEAEKFKTSNPKLAHFTLHKKEADMDFIQAFLREFTDQDVLVFLVVGEDPAAQFTLQGKPLIKMQGSKRRDVTCQNTLLLQLNTR